MASEKSKSSSPNAIDDNLTLSAALLAPINSLFEVQIQAGRALLNFILQIGFKDKYSKGDLIKEESKLNELKGKELNISGSKIKSIEEKKEIDDRLEFLKEKGELLEMKERYYFLKNKERISKTTNMDLTEEEKAEYDKLLKKQADEGFLDEMHNIDFKYFDVNNVEHKIIVPALALVPVQPLAIKSASFEFFMSVDSSHENFNQMQPKRAGDPVRPWMFIEPKRIRGSIGSEDSKKTSAGISIKVQVESTPMPQGLSNLLISLTQSSKIKND